MCSSILFGKSVNIKTGYPVINRNAEITTIPNIMENSYLNFIGYENQDFFPKIEMGLEECQSFGLMRDEGQAGFSFEHESQPLLFSNQKSNNLIHNIFDVSFTLNTTTSAFEKPRKHPPFKISKYLKMTLHFCLRI